MNAVLKAKDNAKNVEMGHWRTLQLVCQLNQQQHEQFIDCVYRKLDSAIFVVEAAEDGL